MKVKIGIRKPNFRGRLAARFSIKRALRHRTGLKAPRGAGWYTNPRQALYNRVYHRTTRPLGCLIPLALVAVAVAIRVT